MKVRFSAQIDNECAEILFYQHSNNKKLAFFLISLQKVLEFIYFFIHLQANKLDY
jgi:hypothetical protein